MAIMTIGIDLAKNVFAVHGVEEKRQGDVTQTEGLTRTVAGPDCPTHAMPDRHGSLHRRPPLGPAVQTVWPHSQAYRHQVRHAVPHERQAWQERCGGCRC